MVSPRRAPLLAAVLALAAACGGSSGVDDPLVTAAASTPVPDVSDTPGAAESPGADPSSAPSASAERPAVTQTDTEWGRIWDAVPAGFPVYPGAVESEEAGGGAPVSATFSVGEGGTDEIAMWLQQQLELATYSTEALSGPLEDGSFVIDSVGDAGCRIETTVAPAGGLTIVTVRYGADCPFK